MIIRIVTVLMLSLFIQACEAETKISSASDNLSTQENLAIEKIILNFSIALEKKDLNLLNTVIDPKEISLIRLFTSGNLGGRGEPLSQITKSSKINSELAFEIENQTPFDLPGLFVNFPIESVGGLPKHTLLADADTMYFDEWPDILKESLNGAPEVKEGDSLLLVSSKYWVYTEAQIIDDILVGGFAVFSMVDGKLKLVALIELL